MYGDTTFIHNGSDIEGIHPATIRGVDKTKVKKVTVEQVKDEDDSSLSYLEDTEPRGYVIVSAIAVCTSNSDPGPLLLPFAECRT